MIKSIAKDVFGPGTRIFLFGSRLDDSPRGGDIDLYVETETTTRLQDKISFIVNLKMKMDDQKIDVVVNDSGNKDRKIFNIAKQTGIEL